MAVAVPFSPDEQAELTRLEAVIDAGAASFLAVARALLAIRDKRLYRAQFKSFDDYLTTRHKRITRQRVQQLVDYVTVADNLSTNGLQIPNERVARELAGLPAAEQPLAYQVAEATAPDGTVTAQWMKATVTVLDGAKTTGGYVDVGNGEMAALNAAITQEAYELMQRQKDHIRESSERRQGVSDDVKYVADGVVAEIGVGDMNDYVTFRAPQLAAALQPGQTCKIIIYVKESEHGN